MPGMTDPAADEAVAQCPRVCPLDDQIVHRCTSFAEEDRHARPAAVSGLDPICSHPSTSTVDADAFPHARSGSALAMIAARADEVAVAA